MAELIKDCLQSDAELRPTAQQCVLRLQLMLDDAVSITFGSDSGSGGNSDGAQHSTGTALPWPPTTGSAAGTEAMLSGGAPTSSFKVSTVP